MLLRLCACSSFFRSPDFSLPLSGENERARERNSKNKISEHCARARARTRARPLYANKSRCNGQRVFTNRKSDAATVEKWTNCNEWRFRAYGFQYAFVFVPVPFVACTGCRYTSRFYSTPDSQCRENGCGGKKRIGLKFQDEIEAP